jgi:hypothetical protein
MKRLDQRHLHPKLEVPVRNQTLASAVGGEHSRKELTDLLFGTSTMPIAMYSA